MTDVSSAAVDVATAARPRSGRQLRIAGHGYEAVIASVGASLRVLTFEGRDLVAVSYTHLTLPTILLV